MFKQKRKVNNCKQFIYSAQYTKFQASHTTDVCISDKNLYNYIYLFMVNIFGRTIFQIEIRIIINVLFFMKIIEESC